MKYDIEVPTTLLKDEVLAKQHEIFPMNGDKIVVDDGNPNAQNPPPLNRTTTSSHSHPVLHRSEGSANLLENIIPFNEEEIKNEKMENEVGEGVEGEDDGKKDDSEEEEIEYFNPTKQNIIKKVVDFSVENKKDKDRLQAIFSNKTFLTETKSLPVSMLISKPDIDDIDIDLDDDPELLQLKLGIYKKYLFLYI